MIWFDIGWTLFCPRPGENPLTPAKQLAQMLELPPKIRARLDRWLLTTPVRTKTEFILSLPQWLAEAGAGRRVHRQVGAAATHVWQQQETSGQWMPGATGLLRELQERDLAYGFISNIWHPYFAAFRACHPELVVDRPQLLSFEQEVAKPDIRLYQRALAHHPSVQAVMIGDSMDNDIIPAQQLGMRTILITTRRPRVHRHGEHHNDEHRHGGGPSVTLANLQQAAAALDPESGTFEVHR